MCLPSGELVAWYSSVLLLQDEDQEERIDDLPTNAYVK
jgi:hypothetical protein